MSLIAPTEEAGFLFLWGFSKKHMEFQEILKQEQISQAQKEEASR